MESPAIIAKGSQDSNMYTKHGQKSEEISLTQTHLDNFLDFHLSLDFAYETQNFQTLEKYISESTSC